MSSEVATGSARGDSERPQFISCTAAGRGGMAFQSIHQSNPERVEVRDETDQWVATFTVGCHTATLAGPERTFREDNGSGVVEVTNAVWVRSVPGPFAGPVDARWLELALAANFAQVPDVLSLAMQYLKNAPTIVLGDLRIAGDASYGPLDAHGKRQEGSDFNDYLGLPWLYASDGRDPAEASQRGCLDCSGYMRMIWGYRHQLPGSGYPDRVALSLAPRAGLSLPRRAFRQYTDGPGSILVPDTGVQVLVEAIESSVSIGDLVFFDASEDDGDRLDHVGMYIGRDSQGAHRFISSRKTVDGPTFADVGGKSVLDGAGLYAKAFRGTRRI